MISRTLGPEFGGSVGILFYFANIVSSALYLAACTEGLVANFGSEGSLVQVFPSGPWLNFGYSSLINVINLAVCLVGAKVFGRTSVFVLLVDYYYYFYYYYYYYYFLFLLFLQLAFFLRMRDSYKRFVKTWIRFANPWIRIDS